MARIFMYEGNKYPDPDPEGKMPVDEVRQSMANVFPELSNAEVKESRNGDDTVFTFAKRVGTKGAATLPKLTAAEAVEELEKLLKNSAPHNDEELLRLYSALQLAIDKLKEI